MRGASAVARTIGLVAHDTRDEAVYLLVGFLLVFLLHSSGEEEDGTWSIGAIVEVPIDAVEFTQDTVATRLRCAKLRTELTELSARSEDCGRLFFKGKGIPYVGEPATTTIF